MMVSSTFVNARLLTALAKTAVIKEDSVKEVCEEVIFEGFSRLHVLFQRFFRFVAAIKHTITLLTMLKCAIAVESC